MGFYEVWSYSPEDIEKHYKEQNTSIFKHERGDGYWLWKPYVISKALQWATEGDILFYCDSGSHFINPVAPRLKILEKTDQSVIPFELDCLEATWTKRDVFVELDWDSEEFFCSRQRMACFILMRKCDSSVAFITEYLKLYQRIDLLTDEPIKKVLPNYMSFKEHSHWPVNF